MKKTFKILQVEITEVPHNIIIKGVQETAIFTQKTSPNRVFRVGVAMDGEGTALIVITDTGKRYVISSTSIYEALIMAIQEIEDESSTNFD